MTGDAAVGGVEGGDLMWLVRDKGLFCGGLQLSGRDWSTLLACEDRQRCACSADDCEEGADEERKCEQI